MVGACLRVLALVLAVLAGPVSAQVNITTCEAACTITHVVSVANTGTLTVIAAPLTSDQIADYLALWSSFLVAAVTVICAKAIYSRFKLSKYEG
jgi:uncharacterized membrane protein AbrB (regulator of aidB expression)